MFSYQRIGTASYETNGGLVFCHYHIVRDGYNDDLDYERRLFIVVEQPDQRNGNFAPSIQINWEKIVQCICNQESLPNYLDPAAPDFTGARSVHWYEWWPVAIHGPPMGYDLIEVQCDEKGERHWVHMAAHLHDQMLATIRQSKILSNSQP